jgi:glutathione peroxidase
MESDMEKITPAKASQATLYSFSVKSADGTTVSLSAYKEHPVLVVNVASRCGFTPQYGGLEELYEKYKAQGLVVLGFPCNQFGAQEPGTNQEIQAFCHKNYDVTFPVMAKIDVNGETADPLYKWLKSEKPGALGTQTIKWNFTKFLIDKSGHVVNRYAPSTEPSSLQADIEKVL